MINFKLKDIDEVVPAGTEDNLRMSWFWLTDSYLWLNLGECVVYEYTQAAMDHLGLKKPPYNDYPLVRFIEDFTGLFDLITESIPKEIYELTKDLNQFLNDAQKWLDIYETDDEEYSDFYFEEYDNLISWTYNRTFDSGHLIGGPHLSFFRYQDKIRIIWDTEHQLENDIELWTAKNGSFEMNYMEFIEHVKDFQKRFFESMDNQVALALEKDWGKVQIDKVFLEKEHADRKEQFQTQINRLESVSGNSSDWKQITELYERMKKELKTKV
jgi:hypothetical protein